MDTGELAKLNDKSEEIEQLKRNIEDTNNCVRKLDDDINKGYTFFRLEVSTFEGKYYSRQISSSRLLGTKEIVRALKDAVSATKGYLHHLEKEFDRR